MGEKLLFGVLFLLVFSLSFVVAGHSIDISGLKSDEYNLGEEVNFQVVLLDGEDFAEEIVEVVAMDALAKKVVTKNVVSNQNVVIKIGSDYPSGIWTINANFEDVDVERSFVVSANLEVEFVLEGDELIIRNVGNVRYTKTVEITIGSEKNSYAQNIGIGEEKVLKLISAEGDYDIVVSDGVNTLRRENVHLSGTTGNVVGAVDKELVGYTGFAGVADATQEDGQFTSLSKLPLALTFVAGVMILGALVFFERRLTRKKSSMEYSV